MDWKRLSEPAFIAAALSCVLLLTLIGFRAGSTSPSEPASGEAIDPRPQLQELKSAVKAATERLAGLETCISKLQQSIDPSADSPKPQDDASYPLHTKAEAEKLIADIGKTPTTEQLAERLAEIDGWVGTPEDLGELQKFKMQQILSLRQLVKKELADLHQKALKAETGTEASEFHAKASQILALYPIDSSKAVLEEAKALSSKHSDVGVRIEIIRRQRYNAWAITRIEETIKAINSIATSFKTSDNPKTIEATVKHLGEVDPILLEPVIAQLYNYAVEQAKGNVNSEQQLELGRRLIDPSIKRKGYGDF